MKLASNPLNDILIMPQIMQKYFTDADILNYIDVYKNSGKLLPELVNSILDLNPIRAKKLKMCTEKVDIRSFRKDILHVRVPIQSEGDRHACESINKSSCFACN